MITIKRWLIGAIVATLCVTLAGCGEKPDDTNKPAENNTPNDTAPTMTEKPALPSEEVFSVSDLNDGTVEISKYTGNEAHLAIPSTIGGKTVTGIGKRAFSLCDSLKSVTIPNSVTYIDSSAFSFCHSLESISISESVTYIGSEAFTNCTGLTSIVIPSSVEKINDSTFYRCSSLTSVTIPNGVTHIGFYAFAHCTSLKILSLPNSIKTMYSDSFKECNDLETVYFESEEIKQQFAHQFSKCDLIVK